MITVKELIEQAKRKFPVAIQYKGRLSDSEIEELEKVCKVRRPSFVIHSGISDNQLYAFDNYEVIGNIYENPELLEE